MQAGFPDPGIRLGYADYIRSLAIVLDAHHLGEDEVAFPALQKVLPLAPYKHLAATHQEVVVLLAALNQAVAGMAGPGVETSLPLVVEGLRKITAVWAPHIRMEESIFSHEALSEVMDPQEQARLSGAMGKHSQEHATPGYLALPFVLFNLNGEDRASMAATLPATVMDELILKAWKEQWAPMKPFLLE
jgi:hypothetical protein